MIAPIEQQPTPDETFIRTSEMAKTAGVTIATVHSWMKYHGYFKPEWQLGVLVVRREAFEKFKIEHPELLNQKRRKRRAAKRRKAPAN